MMKRVEELYQLLCNIMDDLKGFDDSLLPPDVAAEKQAVLDRIRDAIQYIGVNYGGWYP